MEDKEFEFLISNFTNQMDQLKFAELKHGVLITLNGLILSTFAKVFIDQNIYYVIPLAFVFLGIIFSMCSFFPNLKKMGNGDNIFFFGDLAKIDFERFNTLINKKDEIKNSLINEVLFISKIINIKYNWFKYSFFSTFIGLLLFFILFIIYNFKYFFT